MLQQSSQKKIRLIFKILLSCQIVLVGICLIVSCLSIYRSGDAPFTRESIAAHFAKILLPVSCCLCGIVIGTVLSLVFPSPKERPRARVDVVERLKKQCARLAPDAANAAPETWSACVRERRMRLWLRVACGGVCVASALPLIIYLFDISHFTPQLNESVIAATYMALPLALLGGASLFALALMERASLERELKLVQSLPMQEQVKEQAMAADSPQKQRCLNVIRAVVIAVAIVLIVLGTLNGGMRDVLGKAIKICTECIGLG